MNTKPKTMKRVGKKATMSAFFFAAGMSLALMTPNYADAQTPLPICNTLDCGPFFSPDGDAGSGGGGGGGGTGGSGGNHYGGGWASQGATGDGGDGGAAGDGINTSTANSTTTGGTGSSSLGGHVGGNGGLAPAGTGNFALDNPGNTTPHTTDIVGAVTLTGANHRNIEMHTGDGGQGGQGGYGGQGGQGGHGGNAGAGVSQGGGGGGVGNVGGSGGNGGKAAHGDGYEISLGTGTPIMVTVTGTTILSSGDGGAGGTGGVGGTGGNGGGAGNNSSNSSGGPGGQGGIGGVGALGGAGGQGGFLEFNVNSDNAFFLENITVTAGNGGVGGDGGNGGGAGTGFSGAGGNGGNGAVGGKGGTIDFNAQNIILNKTGFVFGVTSGNAGAATAVNGAAGYSGATGGTAGLVGAGGDVNVDIKGDLLVLGDQTVLDFNKGETISGVASGAFNFKVDGSLGVAANRTLYMNLNSAPGTHDAFTKATNDSIHFDTLELWRGSTFETTNAYVKRGVATGATDEGMGDGGTTDFTNYLVDDLVIHTNATWITQNGLTGGGTISGYQPFSQAYVAGGVADGGQKMQFDMTSVRVWEHRGQEMLYAANAGGTTAVVNLSDFLAVDQHANYRAGMQSSRAFIDSAYELKRLDLGTVTLIQQTQGLPGTIPTNGWGNAAIGANRHYTDQDKVDYFGYNAGLRRYYWDVSIDSNASSSLLADNFHTADGYKTYLQGALATTAILNQTFFNTVSPMIGEAASVEPGRTVLNSKITGASVKTETGSDIEVDGFSAALALSHKFENDLGQTTLGVFGEFGYGNYDTYAAIANFNAFGRTGTLEGDGDTKHYGVGLFARHDFNFNTYLEGSVRTGGTSNDYELRNDSRFGTPYNHNYDSDRGYFSTHLGLGQKIELNEQTLLDVYGKILWTRTDSDEFVTDFGEHVTIDAVDSVRHRIGARLSRSNEAGTVKGFVGLAWEHEYDGESNGTVGDPAIGYDPITNAPDVKGSSGFGELGLTFVPEDTNYSVDVSVFGLAGKQKGFGGTAGIRFEF